VSDWFLMAVGAAVFYGLHQVFTKAAEGEPGSRCARNRAACRERVILRLAVYPRLPPLTWGSAVRVPLCYRSPSSRPVRK
jgi:hypothetical protein